MVGRNIGKNHQASMPGFGNGRRQNGTLSRTAQRGLSLSRSWQVKTFWAGGEFFIMTWQC